MGMSEVSIKQMLEDLMFDIDLDALRYGKDFVKDLNRFFKEKGFLTEKQQTALRRIYSSHMGA